MNILEYSFKGNEHAPSIKICIGMRLRLSSSEYILASSAAGCVIAVDLQEGTRWRNEVSVSLTSDISLEELRDILGVDQVRSAEVVVAP